MTTSTSRSTRSLRFAIVLLALTLAAAACDDGGNDGPGAGDTSADTSTGTDTTGTDTTGSDTSGEDVADDTTTTDDTADASPDSTQPDATTEDTQMPGDTTMPDTTPDTCNPLTGSGCATGEKCAVSNQAPWAGCIPLGPEGVAVGQPCTLTQAGDPCVAGAQCVGLQGEQSAFCRSICDIVAQTGCTGADACIIAPAQDAPYGFCGEIPMSDCDPVAQTGCPANQACIAARNASNGQIINTCIPAGQRTHGQECDPREVASSCAAGALCVGVQSGGTTQQRCAQYCDEMAAENGCPAPGVCQDGAAIGLDAASGFSNVGLCGIAQ